MIPLRVLSVLPVSPFSWFLTDGVCCVVLCFGAWLARVCMVLEGLSRRQSSSVGPAVAGGLVLSAYLLAEESGMALFLSSH